MTLFGGDRSVAVHVTADVKGYIANLSAAALKTKDFAAAGVKAGADHKQATSDLARGATVAGLAIGGLAAAAVVRFAQFDQAMSRAAAGTQATAQQMGQLRNAAIEAGRDTQYSATEAADAITAMGKAGVSVNDILGGGLKGALNLAAAGEIQVKDAAEIAATAMTQFGLAGKDLPHVADLLAAGAGKAQGEVTDLAEALKYVGPVAHGMNVSIEETTGVLAEFAASGIVGEQAGTGLRGVLSALTSPSAQAKKEIGALGISLYDSSGKFLGLANVAGQLQQALGGMSDAQRDAALGTIFGNEQVTAARILYQGGAQAVTDWTKKVNDSGYASRQAATLMNNLAGDVEQFRGSLETALIQSGSGANAGLRSLVQGATGAVNAFSVLPDEVQKSTVVIGALAGGSLLLVGAMLKVSVSVATAKKSMDELGISAERTKSIAGGIGKAFGALAILSLVPDAIKTVDERTGAVGSNASKMGLELVQFAQGAKLAGESANVFGSDLKGGLDAGLASTLSLKDAINGISGANFFDKGLSLLVPSQEEQQIGALDKALAGLAQGGHADAAAQAFDKLTTAAGLNSDEIAKLKNLLPEYSGVLAQAATDQLTTGASAGAMATQMDTAAQAADKLAKKLTDVDDAAKKANKTALDGRSAQRDYQQALADAEALLTGKASKGKSASSAAVKAAEDAARIKALDDGKTRAQVAAAAKAAGDAVRAAATGGGKTGPNLSTDIRTDAGRKNTAALDAVASAAQAKADAILASTGSQEQYRASLESSRTDLEKLSEKFYGSAKAAQKYVDTVLKVPAKVATEVQVNIGTAMQKIDLLTRRLAIVGGKTVEVQIGANIANSREDRTSSSANLSPIIRGGQSFPALRGASAFGTQQAGRGVTVVTVPVHSTHTEKAVVNVGKVVTKDVDSFLARRFGSGGVS